MGISVIHIYCRLLLNTCLSNQTSLGVLHPVALSVFQRQTWILIFITRMAKLPISAAFFCLTDKLYKHVTVILLLGTDCFGNWCFATSPV